MKHLNLLLVAALPLALTAVSCSHSPAPGNSDPSSSDSATVIHLPENSAPVADPNTAASSSGIDVSHFQNDVNWDEVKQSGITYAYSKATQGMTDVDPRYQANRAGTQAAGLYHGSYHFFVAGDDPVKQAQLYIKTVGKPEDRPMPPVLDLEQGGMKPGIQVKQYQKDVITWLNMVEKALGMRPVIYTNHPFGNQYLNDPRFAEYELWVAEYGVPEPKIPAAWEKKGWKMWQRTERDKVEGAIGEVDNDLLKGVPADIDNGNQQ
jgi:lysozyme